jgi:hypothetical protein
MKKVIEKKIKDNLEYHSWRVGNTANYIVHSIAISCVVFNRIVTFCKKSYFYTGWLEAVVPNQRNMNK